jgi:hypothetical protein
MQYMKWIFLFIGACVLCAAKAQENTAKAQEFTLSGKVGHYSAPAKAYLLYLLAGAETVDRDSVTMKDGSFVFKGSIPYPEIKQSLKPLEAERLAMRLAYPTADSARKKALAREDDSLEAPKSGIRGCFGARFYAAGHGRSTGVAA